MFKVNLTTTEKIKLLYVTTLPDTQWAFLSGQNNFMTDAGFELHSITSPSHVLERLVKRDNMMAHPVKIVRSRPSLRDLVSTWQIYKVLKKVKPHIVHVSTPKAAMLGSIAARLAGVPIRIFFIRGLHTENRTGVSRVVFRFAEKMTSNLCNSRICVSNSLLQFARSEGILGTSRGKVIACGMSNGIDTNRFNPAKVNKNREVSQLRESLGIPEGVSVIGFVGRLVKDKGIHELARCWKAIREKHTNTHLVLVGDWWDGPDAVNPEIREGLEGDARVHLTGHVEDTAPYYALMSVLVFPSHGTEGFPNVPMEAAAMGIPVVATRVIGCVDAVIDRQTGLIVERGDVNQMTKAILEYLNSDTLRKEHGENARTRAIRDFQPLTIWSDLYSEYMELLIEHGILEKS